MSTERGTVAVLLGFVADALQPLVDDLADAPSALALLANLGLVLDDAPTAVLDLLPMAEDVRDDLATLDAADESGELVAALALASSLAVLSAALIDLGPNLISELGDLGDDQPELDELGRRLLDRLVIDAVEAGVPALHTGLQLLGVFVIEDEPEDELDGVAVASVVAAPVNDLVAAPEEYTRPIPYFHEDDSPEPNVRKKRELRVDRLRTLLEDPGALLEDVYAWGTADFDADPLLDRLQTLCARLGVPASRSLRADEDASSGYVSQLCASLYTALADYGTVEVGAALLELEPSSEGGSDGGLALTPFAQGATEFEVSLTEDVSLSLSGALELTGNVRLEARPPADFSVALDPFGTGAGDTSGELTATLRFAPEGGVTILSSPGLMTLSVEAIEAHVGVSVDGLTLVPSFGVSLVGGVLELGAEDGDAFLQDLIPAVSAAFDVGFEWSSATGFVLTGSTELEIVIPVGLQIGPLEVSEVAVSLEAGTDELLLGVGVTASIEFGPFAGSVDGIGFELPMAIVESGGNLGLLDVESVRFKPPTGLGLAIDATVASGGGYLDIDADAGRYQGIIDVDLLGVGVTAIAVIATQLPDGSDGWSMFLSLSATFTGLQLGFGFTLNGVGGLIGVNRSIDVEALSEGVREGALDSILFPDDPIADAPRILSDLDTIFPTAVGQYVFGPIAKIGWGTPTLFEVDLGIIIQLPDPLTITLLGSFSAALPDADAALLQLNLDVAGTLDLTAGTLAVDASLRDSQVVGLVLSGDMAIRADFVESPSFLLAFGGFNPHFDPPASFPALDRLSVALDTGDNLRVGLYGYFALTSNTVQFGAAAELWASAGGLTVEGQFEFDALIQFNPFYFVIDLGFSVEVRAGSVQLFGVALAILLEGPNPWYVLGTASLKILGAKVNFRVEAELGKKESEGPREVIDVHALLVEALEDPSAWVEVTPASLAVTLAADDGADTSVRLHPAGTLEVRQRVVPLERTLDKYGNGALDGLNRFELTNPTIGGDPASTTSTIDDAFAPGQFYELREDERLSSPSFEQMPAGLAIGDAGVDGGADESFELDYEQIVRDPDVQGDDRSLADVFTILAVDLARAVKRSAVARTLSAAQRPISTSKTSAFGLSPTRFVIADELGHTVATELTPAAGVSWSEAREALTSAPAGSARILVPAYEIQQEVA